MATLMTQMDAPKSELCYLDGNAQVTKINPVSEKISVETAR